METIAIIGPESCGKSTLAEKLVREHPGWILIPEAAREMVERQGYQYTEQDVLQLAREQIAQELKIREKKGIKDQVAVFDTELIITKVWMLDKYGYCPEWIEQHILQHPHDEYLLCYPDIPAEPDPARENTDRREELFSWYEQELKKINANYKIIRHDDI